MAKRKTAAAGAAEDTAAVYMRLPKTLLARLDDHLAERGTTRAEALAELIATMLDGSDAQSTTGALPTPAFKSGDRIVHPKLGRAVVTGEPVVAVSYEVRFDDPEQPDLPPRLAERALRPEQVQRTAEFKAGDRVVHPKLGAGVIVGDPTVGISYPVVFDDPDRPDLPPRLNERHVRPA